MSSILIPLVAGVGIGFLLGRALSWCQLCQEGYAPHYNPNADWATVGIE